MTKQIFKMAAPAKKPELGLLEEDDEFEEFPVEGTVKVYFWCSW